MRPLTGNVFVYWHHLTLVTSQLERFGLRKPFARLFSNPGSELVDLELAAKLGNLEAGRCTIAGRPFDHIDPGYMEIGGEPDPAALERLRESYGDRFGTVVCDGALERSRDPAALVRAIADTMKDDALAVITSRFTHPHAPGELWRASPEALRALAEAAGLAVLECGWIGDAGGAARAAFVTASKGSFLARPGARYRLPARSSAHPDAARMLAAEHAESAPAAPPGGDGSRRLPDWLAGAAASAPAAPAAPAPAQPAAHVPARAARSDAPCCVFLNTYYPEFLRDHYRADPALASRPYEEQLRSLTEACFGDSDYYSRGLAAAGWRAHDLLVNCDELQAAWAREHGVAAAGLALVLEQLGRLAPDVVYCQDMHMLPAEFVRELKRRGMLVVGQIASGFSSVPIREYDVIVSSIPTFVDHFRIAGIRSHLVPLAFEPRVLERLQDRPHGARELELTFIGSISDCHAERFELLEGAARVLPLQFFGPGAGHLPGDSVLRTRYRGSAWGLGMFDLLARSRITLNMHAVHMPGMEHEANNMRLFEATGCGALLITDHKDNLGRYFEIGREVVAYRSPEEAVALARFYLAHPEEAERIARAGQARTLRDHTYGARMRKTAELLERELRRKRSPNPYGAPDYARISWGYERFAGTEVPSALTEGWKSEEIPKRQRALVDAELNEMYAGKPPAVYASLAHALEPYVEPGCELLEIGCSSGYYYEALEYLLKMPLRYTGVDYSAAMIELARELYPGASFEVADGAALPFADRSFDAVVSGCVLLHVPNYAEHVRETARVARDLVVLARTPVSRSKPTEQFVKFAYGVRTVELRFNEHELLGLMRTHGFELVDALELGYDAAQETHTVTYTLRRARQ